MKRRQLLVLIATLPLSAKSHLSKASVSAITDEVGANHDEAMDFVKHYNLQWVELRNIPGTQKEFATLSDPQLKGALAELRAAKLKVSLLHTAKPNQAAIDAAITLGATGIRCSTELNTRLTAVTTVVTDATEWEPAKTPEVPARILNVRADSLQPLNWHRIFETLQRNNYQGQISLKTEAARADEAMRELMHYIGEL